MKKIFYLLAFALAVTGMTACDNTNDPPVEESGITSKDCGAKITIEDTTGGTVNITFDAKGDWKITPSKNWITVEPLTGYAGSNTVNVTVGENATGSFRTGKIHIAVEGFKTEELCGVEQSGTTVEPPTMNKWIHDKMGEMYLWNEEYRTLDMSPYMDELGFSDFLRKGLEGVDAMDHVNIEDGGWIVNAQNQTVREYFSYVKQVSGAASAPADKLTETRATMLQGLGFVQLRPSYLDEKTPQSVGIAPLAVYPNSPADKAGITRGTYITHINGTKITSLNYETLVKQLLITSGTVRLGTAYVEVVGGALSIDPNGPEYEVTCDSYEQSVLYFASVLKLNNPEQTKVGYLTYGQFDNAYDYGLLQIFKEFKENNVDELVIDLRYNGGGAVVSSTMLATLVAGEKYKDQIYTRMEYNRERTEKGVEGEYRIGNSYVPDGKGVYTYISDALQYALNLDHVYVIGTVDTASASEMIINGLRGLGIDVRLVGQRTHGKNVGMEVMNQTAGTLTVEFAPITFRAYNAKGESNYADGFEPDVTTSKEIEVAVFNFGHSSEIMFQYVLSWILTGEKPASVQKVMGISARPMDQLPTIDLRQNKVEGAFVYSKQ